MNPQEVITELAARHIRARVDGDKLKFSPPEKVDAPLLEAIKQNKPALMELLTTPAPPTTTPLAAYLAELAARGFDLVHIPTLRQTHGDKAVTALLATGAYQVQGDAIQLPPTPAPAQTDTERERVAIADALLDRLDASGGVMLTKSFTPAERQVIAWLQDNQLVRVAMGRVWLTSTSNVALTVQACLIQLTRWRKAGFSEVSYTKLGLLYGWGLISHLIKMHVLHRSGDLLQIGDGDGEAVADYGSALVANVHSEATDQAIDQLLAEIYEATISVAEFDNRAGAGAVAFLDALGLVTIDNKRVYPATGRQ